MSFNGLSLHSPWPDIVIVLSGIVGLFTLHHIFQGTSANNDPSRLKELAVRKRTLRVKAAASRRIASTKTYMMGKNIIGLQPDCPLDVEPRWIVFQAQGDFRPDWLYTTIRITNIDPFAVAWAIKGKQNCDMFRLSQTYGILAAGQSEYIKIVLVSSDRWDRDLSAVLNRRLSFVVKNVRVPNDLTDCDKRNQELMSRDIWTRTNSKNPLQRLYRKIFAILINEPKILDQV